MCVACRRVPLPRGAATGGELLVVGLVKPLTEAELEDLELGATQLVETSNNTIVLPNGKTQAFHRAYSTEESYLMAEQHVQEITRHCIEVRTLFKKKICLSLSLFRFLFFILPSVLLLDRATVPPC